MLRANFMFIFLIRDSCNTYVVFNDIRSKDTIPYNNLMRFILRVASNKKLQQFRLNAFFLVLIINFIFDLRNPLFWSNWVQAKVKCPFELFISFETLITWASQLNQKNKNLKIHTSISFKLTELIVFFIFKCATHLFKINFHLQFSTYIQFII